MAESIIDTAGAGGETKASTLNTPDVTSVGDNDMAQLEKPIDSITDDQYPHGITLALLSGSSMIAVFLIALDQASTPYSCRHCK